MYVGVTNDLERRVAQRRQGEGGLFTWRYNVHTLEYAEEHEQIEDAIVLVKEIRGWRRSKKNAPVESVNPTWADLFAPGGAFKDPSLRSG